MISNRGQATQHGSLRRRRRSFGSFSACADALGLSAVMVGNACGPARTPSGRAPAATQHAAPESDRSRGACSLRNAG
ncbi:hypothetical protein ACU4GD_28940 [Cupriavidus basilensis]